MSDRKTGFWFTVWGVATWLLAFGGVYTISNEVRTARGGDSWMSVIPVWLCLFVLAFPLFVGKLMSWRERIGEQSVIKELVAVKGFGEWIELFFSSDTIYLTPSTRSVALIQAIIDATRLHAESKGDIDTARRMLREGGKQAEAEPPTTARRRPI